MANKAALIFLYIGINIPYTIIFLLTFFSNLSRTFAEAAVVIVFLPTFLLYIFLSEKIIAGITGGAIKG